MSPLPLNDRVKRAIALRPMSVTGLARSLSTTEARIREALKEIGAPKVGTEPTGGKPRALYGVAA